MIYLNILLTYDNFDFQNMINFKETAYKNKNNIIGVNFRMQCIVIKYSGNNTLKTDFIKIMTKKYFLPKI